MGRQRSWNPGFWSSIHDFGQPSPSHLSKSWLAGRALAGFQPSQVEPGLHLCLCILYPGFCWVQLLHELQYPTGEDYNSPLLDSRHPHAGGGVRVRAARRSKMGVSERQVSTSVGRIAEWGLKYKMGILGWHFLFITLNCQGLAVMMSAGVGKIVSK